MWFDQDWSLAKCHRVILNSFMHTLIAGLEGEEPVPTYDEVFGLNDPREPMRDGFDDISETSVPFVVNVVNPEKDQDILYSSQSSGIGCDVCHRQHKNLHCALPVAHDWTLREFLTQRCDQSKFFGNRGLYRDFNPATALTEMHISN